MDEEQENSIFSQFEKESLNQGSLYDHRSQFDFEKLSLDVNFDHVLEPSQLQLEAKDSFIHQYRSSQIKAYNPIKMLEKIAPQKKKQYQRLANNYKNFNGLQFFFETEQFDSVSQGQMSFLSGFNQSVFNFDNEPKSGQLDKLFSLSSQHESEKQQIQNIIIQLRHKMNQSQQKCFNSIMLNKTIGSAFYEHFQNFSFVSNPSNFFQSLEINLTNFINHSKRLKGPGPQLIYSIYDFWIKTFKDFVNEIWKFSSKYTLNFLKKQKNSQISDRSDSTIKKQLLKEKRKNWDPEQIRILEKIIDSNVIFSQIKLKQLSEQLGRSVNSISSKIQKIIKSKKGEQYQEDSLLKKTIQVLKLSPQGLNKESIVQKINQYYEMGYDGQWQKSVGQLLSSRKQFSKIKGKYKLISGEKYLKNKMDEENIQKMTFKDKVVKCLLKFDNFEADLKGLIEMYISVYGELQAIGANADEKRKSIQASISKTLSRYDIFDTSNSKTIYKYAFNNENQIVHKPKENFEYYEQFFSI